MPRAPRFLLGVITVRGLVLPVIDLRLRLRLDVPRARAQRAHPGGHRTRASASASWSTRCAAWCASPTREIEPPPPTLAPSEAPFLAGIGRYRRRRQGTHGDPLDRSRPCSASRCVRAAVKERGAEGGGRRSERKARDADRAGADGRVRRRLTASTRSTSCASRRSSTRCAVTPVPKAPPFIEGVIELRGAILPVVDVRKRFDLPPTPPTRATKYLIVAIDVGEAADDRRARRRRRLRAAARAARPRSGRRRALSVAETRLLHAAWSHTTATDPDGARPRRDPVVEREGDAVGADGGAVRREPRG